VLNPVVTLIVAVLAFYLGKEQGREQTRFVKRAEVVNELRARIFDVRSNMGSLASLKDTPGRESLSESLTAKVYDLIFYRRKEGLWLPPEVEGTDACPIATVALDVASTNEPLRRATAEVFEGWISGAARRFAAAGVPDAEARGLAISVLAALEGAFVLARALRSTEPVEVAGRSASAAVRAALPGWRRDAPGSGPSFCQPRSPYGSRGRRRGLPRPPTLTSESPLKAKFGKRPFYEVG